VDVLFDSLAIFWKNVRRFLAWLSRNLSVEWCRALRKMMKSELWDFDVNVRWLLRQAATTTWAKRISSFDIL
jgi:hypothetical protein